MRAAVLGSPIRHSRSPALHTAAYLAAGLDWTYEAIEMVPADLGPFLDSLGPEWAGLSLTMPLKDAVIGLLGMISPTAEATRSVNTVVFPTAPGNLVQRIGPEHYPAGYNTDVDGIVAAVREVNPDELDPSRVAVLGAGATARSAIAAAAELGAREVRVFARRPEARAQLVATGARVEVEVEGRPWHSSLEAFDADLVISTVPAGVADSLAGQVGAEIRSGTLLDVVYSPWPTPLAAGWLAAGGVVAPGLLMLLHQAAAQVRLMTGLEPDVAAMRAAVGL